MREPIKLITKMIYRNITFCQKGARHSSSYTPFKGSLHH